MYSHCRVANGMWNCRISFATRRASLLSHFPLVKHSITNVFLPFSSKYIKTTIQRSKHADHKTKWVYFVHEFHTRVAPCIPRVPPPTRVKKKTPHSTNFLSSIQIRCQPKLVWMGPMTSPILFSFEKIALSNAGTIIPGVKTPNLPPSAIPLGHFENVFAKF
mmetsp:Transcript_20702/g.43228  ORF Transcript_20702/g.43228 Transcript_20702/m.43228 type:complete len:162 (-) Transcript_20702:392-877(-)